MPELPVHCVWVTTVQVPLLRQQEPVRLPQLALRQVMLLPWYVPLWKVHCAVVSTEHAPPGRQQAPVGGGLPGITATPRNAAWFGGASSVVGTEPAPVSVIFITLVPWAVTVA